MSLSVASSNNNPFALWQSLLQPNSTSNAQSDPLASLLASLDQSAGASSSSSGATSSSAGTSSGCGGSSPQLGPQTLQTLFDLQANNSNSQSLPSQLDGGGDAGSSDPSSAPQAQQSQDGSGGANVANNNLLERLIQMQAQLITPAATQNIATV